MVKLAILSLVLLIVSIQGQRLPAFLTAKIAQNQEIRLPPIAMKEITKTTEKALVKACNSQSLCGAGVAGIPRKKTTFLCNDLIGQPLPDAKISIKRNCQPVSFIFDRAT